MATISVPKYVNGAMNYGSFPFNNATLVTKDPNSTEENPKTITTEITFQAVYATKDKTGEPLTQIEHTLDYWDKATATTTADRIYADYYATYRVGKWYRITKAEDLVNNATGNGYYEIISDLDFLVDGEKGPVQLSWPAGFNYFNGKILGVDESGSPVTRTLKNISAVNDNSTSTIGGLFGQIGENAEIKNLNFQNLSFTLSRGSRYNYALFGLFAGEIVSGAKLENVSIESGTFYVGPEPNIKDEDHPHGSNPDQTFMFARTELGILVGSGNDSAIDAGVNYANIQVVSINEDVVLVKKVYREDEMDGEEVIHHHGTFTIGAPEPKEEESAD